MTQVSRPWAGTTIGDAGPYTAPHWWDVWQTFQRGNGAKIGTGNVGVFYVVPGRLEATSPGANSVNIAAGAALVDGLYYDNDAVVNFAVPSAAPGNVRTDRIVIRKTFSGTIQTARLVRLVGVEVASPGPGTEPTLVQGLSRTTYWDVPVCRIAITDAGAITLTDEREYVDAVLKTFHVPILPESNGADTPLVGNGDVVLEHGKDQEVYGNWVVPGDIIGAMTCHVIADYNSDLAKYWYLRQNYSYGYNDQLIADNLVTIATRQVYSDHPIIDARGIIPPCSVTFPTLPAGYWAFMGLKRFGVNVLDTHLGDLYVAGFDITYMGYK